MNVADKLIEPSPITFDSLWASNSTWQDFIDAMEKAHLLDYTHANEPVGLVPDPEGLGAIFGVKVVTKTSLPYGAVLMVSQGKIVSVINIGRMKKGRHNSKKENV